MHYSQKPLLDLMAAGGYPGERGTPKHIETVISNVFLFEDKVYKLYKDNNEFFNKSFKDISNKVDRFAFTRKDFAWNNALSPSIYMELVGVSLKDGSIGVRPPDDDADDLVIVMNRVNTKDVLFERLVRKEVSHDEGFIIGKQLAESLNRVRSNAPAKINYYEASKDRIEDVREWIRSVAEYIGEEESGSYCDYLDNFRIQNRSLFEGRLSDGLAWAGDIHSHNVLFSSGLLYLMDTFPPKEEWMTEYHLVPFYRVGVDIWAISGDKGLFESFVSGYEAGAGTKVDRGLDSYYVMYVAEIAVSYLYMLQRTDKTKHDAAIKFHDFIRNYFKDIGGPGI